MQTCTLKYLSTTISDQLFIICSLFFQGFVTYQFRTNIELRSLSYVWTALEKQFGNDKEKFKGMRFCADKKVRDSTVSIHNGVHCDSCKHGYIMTQSQTLRPMQIMQCFSKFLMKYDLFSVCHCRAVYLMCLLIWSNTWKALGQTVATTVLSKPQNYQNC